ncbi:hypothetical protein [Polaribacter cellanae]|uniref:Uncharacterized protein n=1 Tax=Polaribacter cellanae TaxID=2818493 RepID=A0A975H796_9FLAO|nr:hypothetical protein [Polaribacter cellanae]QTE23281.1 hypothetical protein J3359_03115 [Polaribacter cellanae]
MNEILFYITHYGMYLLYGLIAFLILKSIFSASLKSYHSRWNTLIDDFNFSTKDFYKLLKEELENKGIKRIKMEQVSLKEGNALSSRRSYLRITWKDYQYDICGAPFGNGFFISWWLLYKNSFGQILISKIPFVGGWLARKLYPVTYYKIDTASMFMSYAQAAVLKVIDDITKSQGIRSLSEQERKPTLQDIFKR